MLPGASILARRPAVSGAGVTIYMQNGGVNMTGGATVNLTAPTSGTYQAFFFQARGQHHDLAGGGNTQNMSGVHF